MKSAWRVDTPAPGLPGRIPGPAGLSVLVAEDDADSAWTLAVLLGREGHAVRIAPDGPTAVRLAAEERPDVVLLDIGLPELNGYEVARRITAQPGARAPLVIAVSGYGAEARAEAAGIHLQLTKPADPDLLLRLLRRFQSVLAH